MVSRLTVLGSSGAWPEPGGACSGFLLEHNGFRVALDLGYGTLPRLLESLGSVSADGLDAVVITHKHPDHMVDLHGLFRALWFGRRGAARVPVLAAEGVRERLLGLEEDDDGAVDKVFEWIALPDRGIRLGPFGVDAWDLPHFVPNAGVRLSAESLVVAYTGDTGPDEALVELARDADLFIAEASDRDQQPGVPQAEGPRLHLAARDAGRCAERAEVRRLLLTHFWPGNDRELTRQAAQGEFGGEVIVARDGLEVALP